MFIKTAHFSYEGSWELLSTLFNSQHCQWKSIWWDSDRSFTHVTFTCSPSSFLTLRRVVWCFLRCSAGKIFAQKGYFFGIHTVYIITLHASPTHTCAVSRAGIGWAGFRQIQQFVPILITANRAVHATLKAQNRQEYVSDMSSSLYFHPLSLFLVLPPSAAPSFTLIQWRNFTRQVIKDQSHDARCGCSFNRWQPPSNFSPLPFPLSEKKREEPKQSLANCCVCLSLWKTVSFPTSIIFWDFIFFFSRGGRRFVFFPVFLALICATLYPVPLSALCGGRFEEFCDSKLRHSWDGRPAGVAEQREDARQGLGFIKTQPPRMGTTTQRAGVCEWISEGYSTKYLSQSIGGPPVK